MSMSNNMTGHVAVVTGGTRGIGFGIAQALLEAGTSVLVTGRSADKGNQAAAELGGDQRLLFVMADSRVQAEVEHAIDAAIEKFGHVDILVNNAGGSSGFAEVAELSDEAWREAQDWILSSTFWATRSGYLPWSLNAGGALSIFLQLKAKWSKSHSLAIMLHSSMR